MPACGEKGMPGSGEFREFAFDGFHDLPQPVPLEAPHSLIVVTKDVQGVLCAMVEVRQVGATDVLEGLHPLGVILREAMSGALDEDVREFDEAVERGLAGERGAPPDREFGVCFLRLAVFVIALLDEGPGLPESFLRRQGPFEGLRLRHPRYDATPPS